MRSRLGNLTPASLKDRIKRRITEQIRQELDARATLAVPTPGANDILAALYSPPAYAVTENGKLVWNREAQSARSAASSVPFPPHELRMGHSADDGEYEQSGAQTANWLRAVARREGIDLERQASVMDWGCATARVLRHFVKEAQQGEFWGVDQSGPAIVWNRENLSPPFKFLTCTAYPHLPFEDNKFALIYGLSVFTHVLHLIDTWIMELRRILVPGGCALFTIHDEHTWEDLAKNDELRQRWINNKWWADESFATGLEHDLEFFGGLDDWNRVVSFLRSDWVSHTWGQYMQVVSIEHYSDSYQTAVLLRK